MTFPDMNDTLSDEAPMTVTEARRFVCRMAKEYSRDIGDPSTVTLPQGTVVHFYMVGRNASHEFYVGWDDDGGLWRTSVGDDYVRDENGNEVLDDCGYPIFLEGQMEMYAKPYDPNDPNVYLGHY